MDYQSSIQDKIWLILPFFLFQTKEEDMIMETMSSIVCYITNVRLTTLLMSKLRDY
jgi:hypothetical protein